jgi:hypothetical protein
MLEARARIGEEPAIAAVPSPKPASRRNLRLVDSLTVSPPVFEVRFRQQMVLKVQATVIMGLKRVAKIPF